MAEPRGSINGDHQEHHVQFYGISTCIWCRKTRQFLEEESIAFDFIYVDLLEGDEREAVKDEIRPWNPRVSFPTIVIDGAECIVGFKADELKQVLGL
jgi:glutaredoxin-like protein NrdH